VLISGVIYTGRDAAHKRFVEILDRGGVMPVDLKDQLIYFVGPCPAPENMPIGSAGPTTSYRMDPYSPRIIAECGLSGMIGKGNRSKEVVEAMKEYGAVYFAATGGAGALIAECIKKCDAVAFEELGPEAVYRLEVEDFPAVVAIDSKGNSLYQ
jgi:fumarate hydratase subunit beta